MYRRTKIVATVGPSSENEDTLKQMIVAGVNVFRLNFSHGSHSEHLEVLKRIRKISDAMKLPVAVLQDLSGPKLRISNVVDEVVTLRDGDSITLVLSDSGESTAKKLCVELIDPSKVLKEGHQILLSDGMIELEAEKIAPSKVECLIKKGGRLRSRAGIAFPDSHVDLPATTEKDLKDLEWGITHEVDYVAISFVQNAEDILKLRDVIRKNNGDCRIIAKIERKSALDNIYEILDVTDGLMIARGDLGLELPLEQVPILQKTLIEQANFRGIPVIVATQMLHSMVSSLRPTRAEVSDIANAVITGTDALMLSEETAIGEHPVTCVELLGRVATEAEKSLGESEYKLRLREPDRNTIPDAIAYASCAAANKVNAAALIACTETGNSARLMAKYRPRQPLYGTSVKDATLRRMCLYWGVIPISCLSTESHHAEIETALKAVQQREGLPNGTTAVTTGGLAVRTPGATSVMEIREMVYG